MRKDLRGRIRKLESYNHTDEIEPSRIEILGNDEVEIYTIKNGKEVIMSDEEYEQWLRVSRKTNVVESFEVEIGEWEE